MSTVSTYILLNAFEILSALTSTAWRYIVFDGMGEKPKVSAFQNFLWIENWLNIKKVMGKNVCMYVFSFVSTAST